MNFKRYERKFVRPADSSERHYQSSEKVKTRIDIFGQEVPKLKAGPHFWKLAYKLNHPQFVRIKEDMQKKREILPEMAPYVTFTKAF